MIWLKWITSAAGFRYPVPSVVSHRRPALPRADHIIGLKDGCVEDEGPWDQLLVRCEEMRRLWQHNIDNQKSGAISREIAD